MPDRTTYSRTALSRLIFFAAIGWALVTFGRGTAFSEAGTPKRRRGGKRRLAASLAFATLFFAGASLSALAGDEVVQALEGGTAAETTTTETTPDESTPSDETAAPEDGTADDGTTDDGTATEATGEEPAATDDGTVGSDEGTTEPTEAPAADGSAPAGDATTGTTTEGAAGSGSTGGKPSTGASGGGNGGTTQASAPVDNAPPVVAPIANHVEASRDTQPETDDGGAATIWLHRTMPDPTPPAKRLAPAFARQLKAVARTSQVSWSDILAVVRADGFTGHRPATRAKLRSIARQIAANDASGEWQAFLAMRGRTAWADRAQALARYNRAVGLHALVVGFDAAKSNLITKVVNDHRISIYGGGQSDIRSGRVDVRVLVLLRYLAESHGQVTVSCLKSGHRLYARPGHISAHIYGLAADISGLEGVSIYGHQDPGGVTERAVRNILLLPAELRPQQVISLLGMGGPSFPLANHDDHIHVGY